MAYSNLLMLWDCQASDITRTIATKYDPNTLSLQIPYAFENFRASTPQCELWTNNTIQPIKLFYSRHISTNDLAVIFVNTGCSSAGEDQSQNEENTIGWTDANERGETARQLFKDVLNFYDVNVHVNLSKEKIIAELDSLKYQAGTFDDERTGNETLCIAIVWVGHKIIANYPPHNEIMEEKEWEMPPVTHGTEDFTGNFEISSAGEILCINEHLGGIA